MSLSMMGSDMSQLSRRSFVKGAGMAAGATAALALLAQLGIPGSEAQFAQAADSGKTFIYAIGGDPSVSPNVITTSDRYGLMTLKLVFSPLWMYNADGINYFLAESFDTSDDGITLTVHLREGVKWQDGEDFSADDVVFTYEAIMSTATANQYSQLVMGEGEDDRVKVAKVDDNTVTFTFPYALANAAEMVSQAFIMPKHLYEGVTDFENTELNNTPIGTGPYQLTEYRIGQYLQFKANPDYFFGAPNIENVIFQIITNENTGMQAIQAGEVNAWIGTPSQVEQMDLAGNNLTVWPYSEGRVAYMMINTRRVTNENVRKGILYSFDKPAIAFAALGNEDYYELVNTFLPPESEFYTEEGVELYERDLDKSRQLLADAGQTGLSLSMMYPSGNSLIETCAIIMQEQAAEAGITLNIQALDSTAASQAMHDENNQYDLYFGGYIMGVDPTTFDPLFMPGGNFNYMHYTMDEYSNIAELFTQARAELDSAKRTEIFKKLLAAVADTGAFYPLYSNKRLLVTTNNVTGVEDAQLVPVYTFEDMSKLDMN